MINSLNRFMDCHVILILGDFMLEGVLAWEQDSGMVLRPTRTKGKPSHEKCIRVTRPWYFETGAVKAVTVLEEAEKEKEMFEVSSEDLRGPDTKNS